MEYSHSHLFIYITTPVELNSCNRDCTTYVPKILTIWSFKKSLSNIEIKNRNNTQSQQQKATRNVHAGY